MEAPPLSAKTEEKPLCSKILPSYRTEGFPSTSEELGKKRFEDWLFSAGYTEEAEKLARCSLRVSHYTCPNGHDFYYRQYCGREYCPICGAKDSYYHDRRVMRAAEHFIWALTWGNLTFTIPKQISESKLGKRYLGILQSAAWEVTQENLGIEGAEVATHLLGQEGEGLHVHFEVLFMWIGTFSRGLIPAEVLDKIKKAWALKLNDIFRLDLETTDVRYGFVTAKPKKWHKLKYIHRPICTEEAMLKLSDENKKYILSLKGFHRVKYFGELCNHKIKAFLKKHWAPRKAKDIPPLERKVCPVCMKKLRYLDSCWITDVRKTQVERYNDNIWIDKAVAAFLREQHNRGG